MQDCIEIQFSPHNCALMVKVKKQNSVSASIRISDNVGELKVGWNLPAQQTLGPTVPEDRMDHRVCSTRRCGQARRSLLGTVERIVKFQIYCQVHGSYER